MKAKKNLKGHLSGGNGFVITIGVFDGLHIGHKFILKETVKRALRLKVSSMAITFWPHPEDILVKKFPGHIMNVSAKRKTILDTGIDKVWVLRTTPDLLKMDGFSFIKKVTGKFAIKEMIVGDDFKLGHKSKWGINELRDLARIFRFSLRVVRKIKRGGKVISSSLVRSLIHDANFKEAKLLTGRDYIFEGKVIRGNGLGSKMGFPTANISNVDNFILPKNSVYAVLVYLGRKSYLGAANIGFKPTVQSKKIQSIETYIFNFDKNILGKKVKVVFLEKVRKEKKFSSVSSLTAAIKRDIESIASKYSSPPRNITQPLVF